MKPVGTEDGWKERNERIPLNQPGQSWFQLTLTHTSSHCSCTRKELQSFASPRVHCSSFILLPFWNRILVVFFSGAGKGYGSGVCACICALRLTYTSIWMHTHNTQREYAIHSRSAWNSSTLNSANIIITVLPGLQDTWLLSRRSSGSQTSPLVFLYKWTTAPLSSHSGNKPPQPRAPRCVQHTLPPARALTTPTSAPVSGVSLLTHVLYDSPSILTSGSL